MRTIIAGSRDLGPYELQDALAACPWTDQITVVLSGGARGIDAAGQRWAARQGKAIEIYPADWDRHGKAAGPQRNQWMIERADALIAVWDGHSAGTGDIVTRARRAGRRLFLWYPATRIGTER